MSELLNLESPSSKTEHLRILTDEEIEDLYSLPQLNENERICLFELNQKEQKILVSNTSLATKVDAIVRLGYFKRKQQFFQFDLDEIEDDVNHIMKRYFSPDVLSKNTLSYATKLNNQHWVLDLGGFKLFNQSKHIPILLKKAERLCRLSVNPIFIFKELLSEVVQLKITRPGYRTFQEIISTALISEQKRIDQIIKDHLLSEEKSQLLKLLDQEENFYVVTLLKQQPKNFKPTAIRQEIAFYERYRSLHQSANKVLPLLEISKKGIEYYASLVEHYTGRPLKRTNPDKACLWLLCFIFNRCQRMLDNLATMFIYVANKYQDDVKKKANILLLTDSLSPDDKQKTLAKLIRVYTDKDIDENQPFKEVKKLVFTTILPSEHIDRVANELDDDNQKQQKIHQTKFFWQAVDEFAGTHRPLLRALAKVLVLEGPQHKNVQKAYDFLNNIFKNEQPLSKISFDKFPIQFINNKISTFIYNSDKKTIITNRYEYECYQQIAGHLNEKSLFLRDSINYQSLKTELLPEWEKNKISILKKINRPFLSSSLDRFIEEKARPLDKKIIAVNEAIIGGENPYVKLKDAKSGSAIWTLPYTKKSLELNNPFYEKIPPVSITHVMQFVNKKTQFMRQFTNIKPSYQRFPDFNNILSS